MTVADAARSPLIDELSPLELVVYLRLVGMSSDGARVRPRNLDLYRDARSARSALSALIERGLIRVRNPGAPGREIEVLRPARGAAA